MNGRENVCSSETAERIRRAISSLNYTPNSLTRGLRKAESVTIGVWMLYPPDDELAFGSLYLEQIWRGIIQQADIENYSLLRYPHSGDETPAGEAFLDGRVDGVILHDHSNVCQYLCNAGMPTVLVDRRYSLPEGCGAAFVEQADVVNIALGHLWNLGHRRIAHVAGPVGERAGDAKAPEGWTWFLPTDNVAVDRLDNYCQWMRNRDTFDPGLVGYAQAWSVPQAREMLTRWQAMETPPTAVFCANDAQAADLISAASSLGLQVPGDLSIVGVDDSLIARSDTPQITSVKVPMIQVGQEAVRALLRLLRGAPTEECRVGVPATRISIRQSTAPPRAG